MKDILNKSAILWDFDGVILDSMDIREEGFKKILRNFPRKQVEALLDFHRENGGLSRYVKFRYFLEEIRREPVDKVTIQSLANSYSRIMREALTDKKRLNREVLDFIVDHHKEIPMHLVSGSDGEELRWLCSRLGISDYFTSIEGSPTPKIQLIRDLISSYGYQSGALVLIGDSINDYQAARENQVPFFGYNNLQLKALGTGYINSFR